MIPVLFKGNETNFNHNGIGLLKDALTCEVTEVRNGSFDLELVYPITGPYFKDLKNGNIIQAKPNDTDPPHNFRINEIDKTLSDKEIVVYAVSTTNDLGGNIVKSLSLADVTPQVILNEMNKVLHYPTHFKFVSNITTIGSVNWELNNPLNLIVGEEGSLVDIFGGEVKRTNDTIFLYGRRGKDNVTTIRAGKNLDGFKMTESFQGKYTQILPYFKYEEEVKDGESAVSTGESSSSDSSSETTRREVTIFGSIVSSKYHGKYPVNAIKPIDFSQNEVVREAKTLEALNQEAAKYFTSLYTEIDKPSVNINVDMVQLVDSEQYELYERLEKVELTDTVSVYVPEYDVDVLVKITELKYDSLRERTISIVAGSSGRTSLMDDISGSYKQFTTNLVDDKIQSATAGIVNQVLTQKNGVDMYAGRATPPDGAKPGDIWFKDVGGGDVELYEFDGVNWVRKMYKGFGDDVRRMVDEKIAEADTSFTQALNEHDKTVTKAMTKAGQANDLAQQAKTDATNASLSASRANQEAQQARNDAEAAKADALTAIGKADQTKNELTTKVNSFDTKVVDLTTKTNALTTKANDLQTLGNQLNVKSASLQNKADSLQSQATNLQSQANDISSRLNNLSTDTGVKFQNQSKQLTDLQGNITGIEDRMSKQRVGSRNLLLGTRENAFNGWTDTGEEYLGVKVKKRKEAWIGITSPVKVYAGHEYIFSYYYKLSSDASGWLISYFTLYEPPADKPSATYSFLTSASNPISSDNKEKWLLHTTNLKVTSDGWVWPRVEKTTDTGYLYIGPRQFEEGNVPTQWHPNEEDISEDEMIYRRSIDGTLSQYSSTIRNIDGKVTTHSSQLTQQANLIASKVSQTEFNAEKTKISDMQTSITQQAGQIALKAEKSDIPIVIGGRNLAQKTSSDWSTPYTSFSGSVNTCPSLYKILVDDLEVGDTLKTRIVLKYTNIIPVSGQTARIWLQGNGNVTDWNAGSYNPSPEITISGSGEMVFEHEFKITADHLKNQFWNLAFRTDYIASGSLQWKLAKIEKGPLWTAWSPAPEEFNDAKTKISDMQTSITQQADQIALKAEKTTVDNIKKTVDNHSTSITQQADQIALKAEKTTVDSLTGRLSSAESSITQQADSIASKVSKTDVTNIINDRYVGERNLWIQSKANGGFVEESLPDNHITGKKKCYKLTNNASLFFNIEPDFSPRLYKKVTFSAWIKYENVVQGTNSWNTFNCFKHSMVRKNSSTGAVTNTEYLTLEGFTGTSDWKYISYTYDYSDNKSYDQLKTPILFNLEDVSSGTAWITGVMIQFGTVPTDWIPAPEDTEAALNAERTKITNLQTSITQQADQIALKASQSDLNKLNGRMTTAESSITQLPNRITLAVEEVYAKIPTSVGTKNYLSVSKVVNRGSNNFSYNESTGIWSMTVPTNTDYFGRGIYFDTRGDTVMLNGGETLFIGLTVMVDKIVEFTFDINNRLHVNHTWGNDHDDRSKSVIFPTNKILEPNVWMRVYLMYTAKPGVPIWDDDTNFGLLNRTEDVYLQIKEVTMAKSDIPVDYQKADMDIDQSMSNLKTSIDQTSREIALKANATDLNPITNRLTTAESTIRVQADQIALKAAKTDLTPITNSLNSKVDINQVNSAITAGTNNIRQEVSAVKGVLDGGISARNYAVGTATPSVHSVDSRTETVSYGYVVKQLYTTHQNKTLKELGFAVGDKYTIMFDIYAENNTSFSDYRVEGYNNDTYSLGVGDVTNTIGTPTIPTQFIGTCTLSNEDFLNVNKWVIRFDLSFLKVTIKNFRIFKGEIKQDWYPAWEDQEDKLDAARARIDITESSITSLVSGSKTLPDGRPIAYATKIESLEGKINQHVTTQELNNRGYQTSSDVTNTINGRTDLARKSDIPMVIGGRNMALNTSSDWSSAYSNFNGSANTTVNLARVVAQDLSVGDEITIYMHLYYENIVAESGHNATAYIQGNGNVTDWNDGMIGTPSSEIKTLSGTGGKVFRFKNKIYDNHVLNQYWNLSLRTDYIKSGSIKWRYLKVEKGPVCTSWSPAPEDYDATLTDRLAGYVTNQTYTTYTADRQQTDRQITEQITETVSRVPTGPVNLIVNGFDPQTIEPWTFGGTGHTLSLTTHDFFYRAQKKLYALYTSNTNEGFAWTNIFNLKRNTKYTLRVGLFADWTTSSCDIYFMGKPAGGDFSYRHLRMISDLSYSKVVYYTMTFDSEEFDYGQFRIDNNGSTIQGTQADLYICEVSCIEGEFNNCWTPSFDELITEQKFNETKSTVDSFSRAIGTRDESGFVPNIARLVMTQDSFVTEVAKYGDHNNNLIVDATSHSQTESIGGASLFKYPLENRIDFFMSGATENVYAGFECKIHASRFITGEKYTVSFDYYLSTAPDSNLYIELKDGLIWGGSATLATPSTATGKWHKYTNTFTIFNNSTPNSNNIRFKLWVLKNGSAAIKNIMLVRGEKIGPFSTSQVDAVSTRVEQTANSYAIKFLNGANDITTQLNMTNSGVRIKSSLINLDGEVRVSGQAWLDGAVIKDLSADKITSGAIDASRVRITNLTVDNVEGFSSAFILSVIGNAFIDWMKGKVIQGYNDNMTIDLLSGNISLKEGSNAIKRTKGNHTAFVHFNDVSSATDNGVGSLYACIGVTSSGDGVNSMSSGRFAGLRAMRGALGTEHHATVDQVELYGDTIFLRDDFTIDRGFKVRTQFLSKTYDFNDDVLNPLRFLGRLMGHLNNIGWNWQNHAFLDALENEWNALGMSQYGYFKNNTINRP